MRTSVRIAMPSSICPSPVLLFASHLHRRREANTEDKYARTQIAGTASVRPLSSTSCRFAATQVHAHSDHGIEAGTDKPSIPIGPSPFLTANETYTIDIILFYLMSIAIGNYNGNWTICQIRSLRLQYRSPDDMAWSDYVRGFLVSDI